MTETASNVSNLQTFLPYIISVLCALISGVASYCVARRQAKTDMKKLEKQFALDLEKERELLKMEKEKWKSSTDIRWNSNRKSWTALWAVH